MGKIAFLILEVLFLASLSWTAEGSWDVSQPSTEVMQGGIGRIQFSGKEFIEIKGRMRQQEVLFYREENGVWSALFGVDLEEPPGPLKVIVGALAKDRTKMETAVTFQIKKRVFPTERISVPSSFDQIDEAVQERIAQEKQRFDGLWQAIPRPRLWKEPFMLPIPLEVTSPFGLRRIVNGSVRSPHGGVDLKAALGTEIKSANEGVVALRADIFFTGKTLVVDHGAGLYTMYFHLHDYRVNEGMAVRRGEVLGWAGMTGRVTGPHLHWGVRLNGARVDPLALPGISDGKE